MKFEQRIAIESLQTEADHMAFRLLKIQELMQVQSLCDFNIFWLRDVSPLLVDQKTVDFLLENREKFRRKLSVKEFINADFLLKNFKISNFTEFTTAFKNYKPQIFSKPWKDLQ
jgi:hypothetical protein